MDKFEEMYMGREGNDVADSGFDTNTDAFLFAGGAGNRFPSDQSTPAKNDRSRRAPRNTEER